MLLPKKPDKCDTDYLIATKITKQQNRRQHNSTDYKKSDYKTTTQATT